VKIKILFVDDEDFRLQELQRMLRPMRQEWEMFFVRSAIEALDCMEKGAVDVIVADMHMPGMNGVNLLNAVMERYPKTIRFLLSGHADMESIYKNVGLMHQFLVKPCNENTLNAAVMSALRRENSPTSESLRNLLTKIHRLPSMPALYLELVNLIDDPMAGIGEIGSIISKDMAMTAIVLRLVNSAYFGLRHRVSNATDATKYIGVEMIRSLVLSIKAFSQFNSAHIEGFSSEKLWHHSLATAAAAKTIARLEGAGEKMSDEAFVGGMLHDIGKLVLSVNLTEHYRKVVKLVVTEKMECYRAEQEIFGANHADVGGRILSYWGLPHPVVEAIASHHEPSLSGQKIFSPLTVVHAANALLHQLEDPEAPADAGLDMPYLEELGLVDRLEVWRAALMESNPAGV